MMPWASVWARDPDPLIHSWRWIQPEAAFKRLFYDEMNRMVVDFKADLLRELYA